MTDVTPCLALPLLAAGQAQKEIYHNEALQTLDMLVQPAVQAVGTNAPPALPAAGACWIVGATPTTDWSGQPNALACWTGGGWRFVAPHDGMVAWSIADSTWVYHVGGSWQIGVVSLRQVSIDGRKVVGQQQPAIADASGGAIVDAETRGAVAAILAALRSHGLIAA